MRRWKCLRYPRLAKKCREITQVKIPRDGSRAILEFCAPVLEEIANGGFIIQEVSKLSRVLQGKLQRGSRPVETDDAQRARRVAGGTQHRQHIGRRAESDVPDDELAGMRGNAFGK